MEARPTHGECTVPAPDNGCQIGFDGNKGAWLWKSDTENCCNCFRRKTVCPAGTRFF